MLEPPLPEVAIKNLSGLVDEGIDLLRLAISHLAECHHDGPREVLVELEDVDIGRLDPGASQIIRPTPS